MNIPLNIHSQHLEAVSEATVKPGESELREVIGKVAGRDVAALRKQDDLREVLGLDGLDLIRIVVTAEEIFGLTVDDDWLVRLTSYGDLLDAFGLA